MPELRRIDPEDCGCTDCIVGYSKPIDRCTDKELVGLHVGMFHNASGCETEMVVKISYK